MKRKRDKGLRFPNEGEDSAAEMAKLAEVDKKLILTRESAALLRQIEMQKQLHEQILQQRDRHICVRQLRVPPRITPT